MKSITFEETSQDPFELSKHIHEPIISQFKQLEPLKMAKHNLSKDVISSSPSTSSADTIVTVAMRKSLG